MYDRYAGLLTEDENGFTFAYDTAYMEQEGAESISLTMPLREEPYKDKVLFPFFETGLEQPTGRFWQTDRQERTNMHHEVDALTTV